jgi:hypothetical protein
LIAPLVKSAGGTGKCGDGVYRTTDDADYQAALKLVAAGVEKAWARPRRDLETLRREKGP